MHSARWDPDLDWAGKRIAIIGNGSSAIQILPQMQKAAGHITTYIRSPTWITPNFAAHLAKDGKNFEYTEEEKRRFREEPRALFEYRKNNEHNLNKFFYTFLKDSPDQKAAFEACAKSMRQGLNHDDRLCENIIPKWPVDCRRATPGEGYLEALCEKNVEVESDKIMSFIENGIKISAGEREFDIVVYATGFDVSFTPYGKLVGKNGVLAGRPVERHPHLRGEHAQLFHLQRSQLPRRAWEPASGHGMDGGVYPAAVSKDRKAGHQVSKAAKHPTTANTTNTCFQIRHRQPRRRPRIQRLQRGVPGGVPDGGL